MPEREPFVPQEEDGDVTSPLQSGTQRTTPEQRPQPAPRSEAGDFDLARIADHDLIKRYRPTYLGKGGEHVVFESCEKNGEPIDRDVVVKVEKHRLKSMLAHNREVGLPADALDPDLVEGLEQHVDQHRRRQLALIEVFGREQVLKQKEFIQKIPIDPGLIAAVGGPSLASAFPDATEAWAIVRVQKKAPELEDPERGSVVTGFTERHRVDVKAYASATRVYLEGVDGAKHPGAFEAFTSIVKPSFAKLLREAQHDESLRKVLGDFADKAVAYAEKTGDVLDTIGEDNVIFSKDEEGKWRYRLIDPLLPAEAPPGYSLLDIARGWASGIANGVEPSKDVVEMFRHVVNSVRAVNALSKEYGSGKTIRLVGPRDAGRVNWKELLS